MIHYRITRYDPRRRDAAGRYPVDDWTSIADVGRTFAGIVLTEATYCAVEARYLDAVRHLAREAGVDRLVVCGLELRTAGAVPANVVDGAQLDLDQAMEVARHVLREDFWCRLELADRFRVHFGYDYYLYVATCARGHAAVDAIRAAGLFVEEGITSPYDHGAA